MRDLTNLKKVIRDHFQDLGVFFNIGWSADQKYDVDVGGMDDVEVFVCPSWGYIEILGLEEDEQIEIKNFYNNLLNEKRDDEVRG